MINCVPKQVKRGAIQFGPHSYIEIRSLKEIMNDKDNQINQLKLQLRQFI